MRIVWSQHWENNANVDQDLSAIHSPVVSQSALKKILAILHPVDETQDVLSTVAKHFVNACQVCLVILCLPPVANPSVSDKMTVRPTWLVSMLNAKILVQELVESAPNVPWTITILSVVVLPDMLAILLTGVSWTRSPHPDLILAILHLVEPTLCAPFWMAEPFANA